MPKVDIHRVDDWLVVYVDGQDRFQGHSIDEDDLLEIIGVDYTHTWHEGDIVDEKILKTGQFPHTLEELREWEKDDEV